jgi:hypothetical protein
MCRSSNRASKGFRECRAWTLSSGSKLNSTVTESPSAGGPRPHGWPTSIELSIRRYPPALKLLIAPLPAYDALPITTVMNLCRVSHSPLA